MTSGMINWFGDGNDYVGNPDLKPEVAQTLSLTADWHDSARSLWGFKATPYCTRVRDYLDVDVIGTMMYGLSPFNQLQFANHGAELYGLDLSGLAGLWQSGRYGRGQVKGTLSWVHGGNTDTGQPLYHMMPLNARLALEQSTTAWTNTLEVQWVGRKSRVDPLRLEPETPGYTLVNVRTACHLRDLRLELGVTNLFDRLYDLPLGGVNFDRFMASSWTGPIQPLTGPGRSLNAGVALTF